jgi:ubiquinone/menaquinone biosynthesis C-methylase UbiE
MNDISKNSSNVVRAPRLQLTTAGQASPPELGEKVAALLKDFLAKENVEAASILDVGCGLGNQMALIKERCPGCFGYVAGVDWSPATVNKHNSADDAIYNEVVLCSSDRLPYEAQKFDLALSMENLEHLYEQDSIRAISEMMRVAKYIVISTPPPSDCINFRWLYPELVQAVLDDVPLTSHDFICMESAVHKSTIFPASMRDAGFDCFCDQFACYYIGESSRLDVSKVECVGMPRPTQMPLTQATGVEDHNWRYVQVLAHSAHLQEAILDHPLFNTAGVTNDVCLPELPEGVDTPPGPGSQPQRVEWRRKLKAYLKLKLA